MDRRSESLALGTIKKSIRTYASELRTYKKFCDVMSAQPIPAEEATIKRFVSIFRCPESAHKYVSAIRWAHHFMGVGVDKWDTASLAQVLKGSKKLRVEPVRKASAIRWPLLRRLVKHALLREEHEQATAYVLAANFLFRVPSELVPLRFDGLDFHSSVKEISNAGRAALEISLKSRKNRDCVSVLVRSCRCPDDKFVCPVHRLSDLVRGKRW